MTDKPTNSDTVDKTLSEGVQPESSSASELGSEQTGARKASSQDSTAFDTADTLVTPAAGTKGKRKPKHSGMSTASVTGLDQDITYEIPKEPQLRFGRFVTEGTIGKGGMGVVFRAIDPLIGRTVAIKALRTDHGIGGDSLIELQSRFELEFKSAGNLSHPNIVTIYDVGQEEGVTFIAMEFVDGRSLEQLLREGDVLSFERIGELISGICAGLDYAHEAAIVHRDIKPANILIDPTRGRPKITDFGVAKVQSSGLTQTGTVIGTPAYMSPEQILGKDVSGRSDQFSAAVILYQMLTGTLPFGSDAPASILFRIVHSEPTPPHELNPDVPEAFSVAIAKAFSKDPAGRYESCAEMAEATSRALVGKAPPLSELESGTDPLSFKSVTLSTTEPLRGSGTYAGAGSWWQRRSAAPRVGMTLLGALLFAGIGWVGVANYMGREPLPFELPFDVPFLQQSVASQPNGLASNRLSSDAPGTDAESATGATVEPTVDKDVAVAKPVAPLLRTYTIDSNRKGAAIRLDGKVLEGVTPFDIALTVGKKYEITVSLEGYKNAGTLVTAMQDGTKDVFLALAPDTQPGRITFTKPEGYGTLIFEVNGKRIDPTRIAPGKVTLTVRSPGNYFTANPQTITILEGKATAIKPLPALQKIKIVGIGVGRTTVSIDGGSPISSLPHDTWLAPGTRHKFAFTFDNGDEKERSIMIGTTVATIVGSAEKIKVRRKS